MRAPNAATATGLPVLEAPPRRPARRAHGRRLPPPFPGPRRATRHHGACGHASSVHPVSHQCMAFVPGLPSWPRLYTFFFFCPLPGGNQARDIWSLPAPHVFLLPATDATLGAAPPPPRGRCGARHDGSPLLRDAPPSVHATPPQARAAMPPQRGRLPARGTAAANGRGGRARAGRTRQPAGLAAAIVGPTRPTGGRVSHPMSPGWPSSTECRGAWAPCPPPADGAALFPRVHVTSRLLPVRWRRPLLPSSRGAKAKAAPAGEAAAPLGEGAAPAHFLSASARVEGERGEGAAGGGHTDGHRRRLLAWAARRRPVVLAGGLSPPHGGAACARELPPPREQSAARIKRRRAGGGGPPPRQPPPQQGDWCADHGAVHPSPRRAAPRGTPTTPLFHPPVSIPAPPLLCSLSLRAAAPWRHGGPPGRS